ncbi:unnamed protein product [Leptidea sinapis]|uniref:Ig-like domain-containing protein n=1 Tax=Leptidea sinapis TaxID=189913 RepID=A0A5E4QHG6_9NEOP|nr:unnamed protein product [Leptidea sinapis]
MSRLLFIFLLLTIIAVPFVLSKRSLVFVVDTTISMTDEISIIKSNINATVDSIKDFDVEFILLPFADPEVGPPINETTSGFLDMVHLLEEKGENDCPEESLGAIKMALQRSGPNSHIYVFTDAKPRTKDIDEIKTITNMCDIQKSQVLIFLTGKCSPTDPIDAVYYDVAKNCRGSVILYDLGSLRHAFKYIKEIVKTQWNQVDAQYDFLRGKNISFAVDTYTTDMMISVAGEHPDIEIINHLGEKMDVQRIINTSTACVVIMQQLTEGEYKAAVTGVDYGMVTIYTRRAIHVEFGFSSKLPRSLDETSKAPIPGISCYILVILDANLELTSIKLQIAKTGEEIHLQYQALDKTRGYYVANNIFEHGKTFKLSITARHKENKTVIEGVTPPVKPQDPGKSTAWMKPVVQLIGHEMNWADFGDSTTFACKVTGFPKPRIIWTDDIGNTLPFQCVLVEIPSVYLTYANVANATRNSIITCTAENAMGADAVSIKLFVNRTNTFKVLKSPSDITVQYGEEGRLYCEVDAHPRAEITWLHNNTAVVENDNIKFEPENHALVIRNMDIESTGEYICEINNNIESRSLGASVVITGLVSPYIKPPLIKNITQPLGTDVNFECYVERGTPVPSSRWEFMSPNGNITLLTTGNSIGPLNYNLKNISKIDEGIYSCTAGNMLAVDTIHISLKVIQN